ncbi:hypothetical protein ASL20_16160 [Cupriavidus necator]|uniref:phosphatase PAP2 family protein n=1 Tax=Cupriavidus necator TaxID=106590 RepID=UPI00073515C3|nr:phosphatase PAP2 family protein [Cupriavidus necator]KUE87748.1 hypothetical protein ASL20_16160 [Cupriavidus necator]
MPIILLGDSRLVLPLAAAIALWLTGAGQWRHALRWLVWFGSGAALVAADKLAFASSGWSWPAIDLYVVSGHAMLTTATYPVLLMLMGARISVRGARCGWLAGLGMSALMCVVLVAGHYHTIAETLAGAVIGLAICTFNAGMPTRLQSRCTPIMLALLLFLACAAAIPAGRKTARHAVQLLGTERQGISLQYLRHIHVNPDTGKTVVTVLRCWG